MCYPSIWPFRKRCERAVPTNSQLPQSAAGLVPVAHYPGARKGCHYTEYRKNILHYLGFRKFDAHAQTTLQEWLKQQTLQSNAPEGLFQQAEKYLLSEYFVLPGTSVLERLIVGACSTAHEQIFEALNRQLSPGIKEAIDNLLTVPVGEQRSAFFQLKEYPPHARVSSLKDYLQRYRMLVSTGIDDVKGYSVDPAFISYLYRLTKSYSAKDIKRFKDHKRYSLMVCFLLETRKVLLDHLVKMHDQYVLDMCRHSGEANEKKHREIRNGRKRLSIQSLLPPAHCLIGQMIYRSIKGIS
jgi:hypothetical protein